MCGCSFTSAKHDVVRVVTNKQTNKQVNITLIHLQAQTITHKHKSETYQAETDKLHL